MRVALLTLVAGCLLALTAPVAAGGNTAPLADAGVDQTVTVGSTVYLDATGSVDPDGGIRNVSWSITSPDGATRTPACAECRQTEFEANTTGRYTVALTVTDDAGATSSDTLYVTVTNATGPEVSLSGPGTSAVDSNATFQANVSADGASLQSLAWVVNGSVVRRQSLDGTAANRSLTHAFDQRGTVPVRAVAHDVAGYRGSTTHSVGVGTHSRQGDLPCDHPIYKDMGMGFCEGGADKIYSDNDGTYVIESNGMEGIQLNNANGLILAQYDDISESKHVTLTGDETYRVDDGVSVSEATAELEPDFRVNKRELNDVPINEMYNDDNKYFSNDSVFRSEYDQEFGFSEANTNDRSDNSDGSDDGDDSNDSDGSGSIGDIVDTVTDPFDGSDSGSSDSGDGGNAGDSNGGDDGGGSGVFTNPLF